MANKVKTDESSPNFLLYEVIGDKKSTPTFKEVLNTDYILQYLQLL